MICCGQRCAPTGYSFVCTGGCGSERLSCGAGPPGYQRRHAPLRGTTYSRRYRFSNLLLKTVGYHAGPPASDPVWAFLEGEELKTPGDIQRALGRTTAKNKRYCSLPCFARVFCPAALSKQTVSEAQIRDAMALFDGVERRWARHGGRFFSYYFLLELILTEVGAAFALLPAKRLICKHRRAYYREMMKTLGGLRAPGCATEERGQKRFAPLQSY